jgi:hypothetical protein
MGGRLAVARLELRRSEPLSTTATSQREEREEMASRRGGASSAPFSMAESIMLDSPTRASRASRVEF